MSSSQTINALADGVYASLMRDDIPQAMQLAWHLMQHPYCPIALQAQAVLVHSAGSLRFGGDVRVIEGNIQSMIKRVSTTLAKQTPQNADPTLLRIVSQLRGAASSLRSQFSSSPSYHPYARPSSTSHSRHHTHGQSKPKPPALDLDSLIDGFGKLGLGLGKGVGAGVGRSGMLVRRRMGEEIMIIQEEDESEYSD